MKNIQPSQFNNDEIVEIRECTNDNEPNSATHDSHRKSQPQTKSVPGLKFLVTNMTTTKSSKSDINSSTKQIKMKGKTRTTPQPGIKDDLTVLAHISLLIYVIIICYLCLANPFTFFTWHPLLLTIGWALLTTEAVLFISKENPVVRLLRLNHTWKLRYHWILLTVATILVTIGFIVVVVNKNNLNKDHFKTWHGLFGLISLISVTPVVLNGIGTLYDVNLKSYIKPNVIKLIHQASGTAAFIFGGIALILSVYTKWFTKNSGGNKYVFLTAFITVLYSFLWTLQRPFLKCLRKMFKVPF